MAAFSLVALVALAVVATWAVSAQRRARAEATWPPEGEFVDVGGRRVHAVISGEGPDVVLIHGAFGSLRDYTFDLVDRLSPRYRVIAIDRPGLGYSDHSDTRHAGAFAGAGESPAEQAEMLAAAARKLGADRPIVVGHSFGGIVALAWGLDQDPAALVLLAGVAMPWPGDLGWMYRVNGTALGGAIVAPAISAWTPTEKLADGFRSTFAPQAAPEGYASHIGPYMPVRVGPLRATTRQVNTLRPHVVEMEKRYGELDLPIELIHGSADTSVPLKVHAGPFSEVVPSARLQVLEGIGHMPHHADPDATIAAIDRAADRAGLR